MEIPIKTGWQDAPLVFCNLKKAFEHNTICDSNGIQTCSHLVLKRTLNHFTKLVKWLTCVASTCLYGIHLNFRYRTCFEKGVPWHSLTLSRRRPLSYRNQSIDLLRKSIDWFLYHNGLRHERVNFKIYDVINWETINCNTHIAYYLKK